MTIDQLRSSPLILRHFFGFVSGSLAKNSTTVPTLRFNTLLQQPSYCLQHLVSFTNYVIFGPNTTSD
ncbi:hypothetical protein HAX54_047579, partial [Datura stramonium]|nr:hypothetical protein [Datura stramonium]